MPKKWVREARRQAREEAYRSVSAESHALERETRHAQDVVDARPPLPIFRTGPIQWRDAGTRAAYFRSLLNWVDEARDHVFNGDNFSEVVSPETAAVLAAVRLVVSDWLVRSTKVRLCMSYEEAFYNEKTKRFQTGLFAIVSTRITNIGSTSIETEHEIRLTHPSMPRQHGTLAAIVSGTIIPVVANPAPQQVPLDPHAKEFIVKNVVIPGMFPLRAEFPTPPPSGTSNDKHSFVMRKSDLDAFQHLNNCTAMDAFTDAISEEYWFNTNYFVIEYPKELRYQSSGVNVTSTQWHQSSSRGEWNWIGQLMDNQGTCCVRALFTSNHTIKIPDIEHVSYEPSTFAYPFHSEDAKDQDDEVNLSHM